MSADFDWDRTSAFPRLGRRVFDEEPLWVDSAIHSQFRTFKSAQPGLSRWRRALILRDTGHSDRSIDRRKHPPTPTNHAIGLVHRRAAVLLAAGVAVAGYSAYHRHIEALAAARRTLAEFTGPCAAGLESDEPLTAALVLSELDDS